MWSFFANEKQKQENLDEVLATRQTEVATAIEKAMTAVVDSPEFQPQLKELFYKAMIDRLNNDFTLGRTKWRSYLLQSIIPTINGGGLQETVMNIGKSVINVAEKNKDKIKDLLGKKFSINKNAASTATTAPPINNSAEFHLSDLQKIDSNIDQTMRQCIVRGIENAFASEHFQTFLANSLCEQVDAKIAAVVQEMVTNDKQNAFYAEFMQEVISQGKYNNDKEILDYLKEPNQNNMVGSGSSARRTLRRRTHHRRR